MTAGSTEWVTLGLCVFTLAVSTWFVFYAIRWIRAVANVELEASQEMRMLIHDLMSRDPQLEEPLRMALFKVDDWDRKMRRLRLVTFGTIFREKP